MPGPLAELIGNAHVDQRPDRPGHPELEQTFAELAGENPVRPTRKLGVSAASDAAATAWAAVGVRLPEA